MVLNVGIISAVIFAKKQPNYKTRLQKLQEKYKNKPLNSVNLYQIPTKYIVSIGFIIIFLIGLHKFSIDYSEEILNLQTEDNEIQVKSQRFLIEVSNIQYHLHSENQQPIQATSYNIYQKSLVRLKKTIKWINIFFILIILGIFCSQEAKVKVITINKQQIKISKFSIYNLHEFQKIIIPLRQENNLQKKIQERVNLQIIEKGSRKFSYNTQQYYIRLTILATGKSYEILKRYDIYHSRKAIIEISSVLGLVPNLSLKRQ